MSDRYKVLCLLFFFFNFFFEKRWGLSVRNTVAETYCMQGGLLVSQLSPYI